MGTVLVRNISEAQSLDLVQRLKGNRICALSEAMNIDLDTEVGLTASDKDGTYQVVLVNGGELDQAISILKDYTTFNTLRSLEQQ